MKDSEIKNICDSFRYEGVYINSVPYGEGHINNTYLINTTTTRYILQMVNKNVFKEPEKVMKNVELVTNHLHKKIIERRGDVYRETLTLVPTKRGKKFVIHNGDYYRMYLFIEDAVCYQIIENEEVFYEAARAFGSFQKNLADFDASVLSESIANFHNTKDRFEKLKTAIKNNVAGRLDDIADDVKFALDRENITGVIVDAIDNGEIPLRVTHNDTKLNNVMMDEKTGSGISVIDLDTVMPGSLLYDFGDSIRFGASSAAEDETDLSKVEMKLELFDAYTRGYLEVLGDRITINEAKLLPFSALLMTYECGIRFLTDYLENDVYFKTSYPTHNLDRARNQFKLVADMESKLDEMKKIVYKYMN